MTSWAAVASKEAVVEPAAPAAVDPEHKTVAVVDANAVIYGVPLDRLADKAVTVPEVLEEIRDKRSRATLAALPVGLETKEPSEDSLKTVSRFARATGDLQSLSAVDIKLIALAHTLEGGAWAQLDLMAEEELAAAERAQGGASAIRGLPGEEEAGSAGESGHDVDADAASGGGGAALAGLSALSLSDAHESSHEGWEMGLRLVAPNGMHIHKLSRWVLRCSACFCVSKEIGRLFCPKCGNASLDKVEVVVGPDGAEQYGIRKRHILRGTRFSLPKPVGGKNNQQPILREDVLMSKLPRMHKPRTEETDPFAPEFGADSWHLRSGSQQIQYSNTAALLAGWKHNPNERRHTRTNRRKK
ncbi:hypothetical protein WJX72_010386 [[Myrmecia] bisecta]|uniref:RNA-binding protein NOB1 n=1 Tax=[Myrmecia] bisecta TaxID=41462 RepID=A0AAW1PKM1_9CHLO